MAFESAPDNFTISTPYHQHENLHKRKLNHLQNNKGRVEKFIGETR